MHFYPIQYDQPLFRPPAEAYSAIIQATIGCSWNKCAFCEMYTSKKFKIRKPEEIFNDISVLSQFTPDAKRVFLADGNAFVLSADKLLDIIDFINQKFNKLQRISAYAMPRDILNKTDDELLQLRQKGLKLLYIGLETGDDELLRLINKNETFQSSIDGILKAHKAGIDTSIMILNGLGGKKYSEQHAKNSALLINKINPKYLSTLTLSFPYGKEHFKEKFGGEYESPTLVDLYKEMKIFIENLDVKNVIFRSNHVSNNLNLEGILSKDNLQLIKNLELAIKLTPENLMPIEAEVL